MPNSVSDNDSGPSFTMMLSGKWGQAPADRHSLYLASGLSSLRHFFIVAKISLSDVAIAKPPYIPTWDPAAGWEGLKAMFAAFDLENYVWLTEDDLYWKSYLSSLKVAIYLNTC